MGLDDELPTSLVENIAKQQTTSSCDRTCNIYINMPLLHVVTWPLQPTTTHLPRWPPPQHIAQRRCASALPPRYAHAASHKPNRLKRPRLPKNLDNCPTNVHDRLTMTPTTCDDHNHRQTMTSAHEKHQLPPPAHPTASALSTKE